MIEDKINLTVREIRSELICINCHHRFLHDRPSDIELKYITCSMCWKEGCVIETGQDLSEVKP